MIHFGALQYVWLLLLLLLVIVFLAYRYWKKYGTLTAKSKLIAYNRTYTFNAEVPKIKIILIVLGLMLIGIGVLRPQWGLSEQTVEKKGLDILFALDVSNSMKAQDFSSRSETVDRLQASKFLIQEFVKTRPQDRLGLVEFAGETFVASPLTLDHAAFLNFLTSVGPDDVGKQGTDLAEALAVSLARFQVQSTEERGKAIILISDGDETVDSSIENLARKAQAEGIKIYTIGVGSPDGAPIPDRYDTFGRVFYKQYRGETVISKLNPAPLKRIAHITDGTYFRAKDRRDILQLSEELKELPVKILEDEIIDTHSERYQRFVALGLLLLLSGYLLPWSNLSGLLRPLTQKNKLSVLTLLIGSMILSGCSYQNELLFKNQLTKGNNNFVQKEWNAALSNYQQATNFQKNWEIISQNNQLAVSYEQKNYEDLIKNKLPQTLEKCSTEVLSPFCENLWYLAGNSYYRWGQAKEESEEQKSLWESAIQAYQNALIINPQNTWAQENIDFILKTQQEQKQSESSQENQNSEGQKSEDSDQKQNDTKSSSGEDGKEKSKSNNSTDQSEDPTENDQSQEQNNDQQNGKTGSESGDGTEANGVENESNSSQDSSPTPSRLPQAVQEQLESYQEQLEQAEQQNQEYFHRSQASAQNQAAQDPFDHLFPHDSLLKEVFGHDPFEKFFGRGEKRFHKNINTNEKDW